MKTVSIHARINPEVKMNVENILDDLGLTTTEAIKLYFNQIILTNGIPFELKLPNLETQKAIEKSKDEKNLKTFKNTQELFEELNI